MLGVLLAAGIAAAGSGAFLGVVPHSIDEEIAEDLGYEGSKGVYISSVVEGTAADKAGMKDDDVIVEFAGDEVVGDGHLRELIGLHAPGDKVKIKVWRDGKTHTLTAELGEQKGAAAKIKKIMTKFHSCDEPKAWLGIKMQGLTDQLADYFGVEQGALVTEVVEDSPAEKAGLRAGDVITSLGDKDVETPSAASKIVGEMEPGQKVSISFVRKGSKMSKEAELVEPPEDFRKKCMVHIWHGDDDFPGAMMKKKILGLEGLEALKDLEIEIPEIEIEVHEDMEELREELDELREELEELKEELKESD